MSSTSSATNTSFAGSLGASLSLQETRAISEAASIPTPVSPASDAPSLAGRVIMGSSAPSVNQIKEEIIKETLEANSMLRFPSRVSDLIQQLSKVAAPDVLLQTLNEIEETLAMRAEERGSADRHETLLYQLIGSYNEAALIMINAGVSTIHSRTSYKHEMPLHRAARCREVNVVKALVLNGADVNAICNHGLIDYCRNESERRFYLISPLSSCLEDLRYLLHFSKENMQATREIFSFLFAHGANPEIGCVNRTPISTTLIQKGYPELAEMIADKVPVDDKDLVLKVTPLLMATARGDHRSMRTLLERRANPNILGTTDFYNCIDESPLHAAVRKGDVEAVKLLLAFKADPNFQSKKIIFDDHVKFEKLTPFQLAVDLGQKDCARVIVEFAKAHNIALDASYHGDRSFFDGKGDSASFDLRIKAEHSKGDPVYGLPEPYRVFSRSRASHELIRKVFTKISKDGLGAAYKLCAPFIALLQKEFRKNEDFGITYLAPHELAGKHGCYHPDAPNEIVLARDTSDADLLLYTLLHESVHKSAHLIYGGRRCDPSGHEKPMTKARVVDLEDFSPKISTFKEAIEADLHHLRQTNYADCDSTIHSHVSKVLRLYDEQQQPAEFLARIPEAAAFIAWYNPEITEQELEAIFMKSIPNMYRFYMEDFLPRCQMAARS